VILRKEIGSILPEAQVLQVKALANARAKQRQMIHNISAVMLMFLGKAVLVGLLGAATGFALGTGLGLRYRPGVFEITAKAMIRWESSLLVFACILSPLFAVVAYFDTLGERLAPGGVLQLDSMTVVIPVLPAFPPINQVRVLVGGRVVRGHRRTIWIAGIKVSAARIHLDAVVIRMPPWISVSLGDHIVRCSIRLKSMLWARTPADCDQGAGQPTNPVVLLATGSAGEH